MHEYKEPFRVGCATLSVNAVSSTAWDVHIVYDNGIKAPRRITINDLELVSTIIGHVTADQQAMTHKGETMPDEINLSEYKEPLTTAARGIATASWLMEKAKAKGKDTEVKRLMAQIDRLELAVAKYLESRNEGTK